MHQKCFCGHSIEKIKLKLLIVLLLYNCMKEKLFINECYINNSNIIESLIVKTIF